MHPIRSIALLVAAGALVACTAKDSKPDSAAVAQAGAGAAAPKTSQASFDPATRVAVVHARDYAFDAPDSISAGWTTFHLVNDGPGLHHVQLVRLDSGKTAADLGQELKTPGPLPRWAVFVGGPNAVDPGGGSDATIDLQPGQYMLLCLVDIPGNVPHVAKGMVRPFTVTAASGSTGSEPTSDATVALTDYAFTIQGGTLSAGKHTIKVVNNGAQPHELALVQFAPGKNARDLAAWIAKQEGPPPAHLLGGVDALAPGASGYFETNLAAGNYGLFCFLPDVKDAKPHVEHGMVKEIAIK